MILHRTGIVEILSILLQGYRVLVISASDPIGLAYKVVQYVKRRPTGKTTRTSGSPSTITAK